MNPYLEDTKYAASELIKLLSNEEKEVQKLLIQAKTAEKELENRYMIFRAGDLDIDDSITDAQIQRAYGQFYSHLINVVKPLKEKIAQVELSLVAKDESIRSLCGALLQIAKQGISIVHSGLQNCPNGRLIGSETLKNIIWQGRNQSMHYEESRVKPYKAFVSDCFTNLERDFGSKFTLTDKNLSREIVYLLGWDNYQQYENDMISLLC